MSKYPTEKECSNFNFSKYRLIRSRAIRLKCLDCCSYQENEVRQCPIMECPLWSYRSGHYLRVPVHTLSHIRKKASNEDNKNEKQRK
jgi:hypothetical protein